jgi:hypothetical protein
MIAELLGFVASALLSATVAANASPYTVTLEQVGSNVVATGSGNIDLTGLLTQGSGGPQLGGVIDPTIPAVGDGTGDYVQYTSFAVSGPSSFGTGSLTETSTLSGSVFDFIFLRTQTIIRVPTGYTSDSFLSSSTATFDNTDFALLGVTLGSYVWTWGNAADQSFTLDIVAQTPLPTALPLFASGLGLMGFLAKRRKRKNVSAIAA